MVAACAFGVVLALAGAAVPGAQEPQPGPVWPGLSAGERGEVMKFGDDFKTFKHSRGKRRKRLRFFAAFVAKEGQFAPAALILDDDLFMSQVRDRVAVFVESDESELDQRGPGAEDRNFVLCERGETERQ
jgi:hypothetical protein